MSMDSSNVFNLSFTIDRYTKSNVFNLRFLITSLPIITLDYTEDLPAELPLSQFNSALKQYISFYSGVYVVDDSNVNVVIENDTETTKKVIFYVAYEEGENAYSGYFEKIINIKEVINTMANFNNLGLAEIKYKKSGAADFTVLGMKKEGTSIEAAYEEMFEAVMTHEGGADTPFEEVISGQKFGFNLTVTDYTATNLKDLTQFIDGTAGYEVGNNIGSLAPSYEVIIHFINDGADTSNDIYIPKCSLRIVNNVNDTVNMPNELVIEAKAHWDTSATPNILYKIGQNPA